jgi:multiphosphoryl transfer protein
LSKIVRGAPASPGVGLGPMFVVEAGKAGRDDAAAAGPPDEERRRLQVALEEAVRQLGELTADVEARLGKEEAAIFRAQAAFASDRVLQQRAGEAIESGNSAESAITGAFRSFRDEIEASSNPLLKARAADIDDVNQRVLGILGGAVEKPARPELASVIVASDLTPSQTAGLPSELVLAIATEGGTPTSHAAILARAMGVPAVVGAVGLLDEARGAEMLAVDGGRGEVLIDPEPETLRGIEEAGEQDKRRIESLSALRSTPGATRDGHPVELAANIGSLSDLEPASAAGAQGTGLVRTEFLFQDRATAPSVDEQTEVYRKILDAFPGHRVVFRTLDVGADKPLPFIDRPSEANPALGVRGIRLGLSQPRLLTDQLHAVLRACRDSPGRPAVMFPMVTRIEEVDESLSILAALAEEEGIDLGRFEVGAMIETPIAALSAGRLARAVDFVSVGTNDLLQYLFAADRLQSELAGLPELFDPAVLSLLSRMVVDAHQAGAWVGVCGEAAGTPVGAAVFVGLGCDELSMAAHAIPLVKDALRRVTFSDLEQAVGRAMVAEDAGEARRLVLSVLT